MSKNTNTQKPVRTGEISMLVGLIAVVLAIVIGFSILVLGAVQQFERHKKMLAYHKDIPAQTQMANGSGVEAAYEENIE